MTVASQNQNKDLLLAQKILFVDDEVTNNDSDREDIIIDLLNLGVQEERVLFTGSFDEASKLIKNSIITFCFLDLKIPKTDGQYNIDSSNINQEEFEWGFLLIPLLDRHHKSAKISIYSCYAQNSYISDRIQNYNNIIGVYGKSDGVTQRKQLFEEMFSRHEKNITALTIVEPTIEPEAVEEVRQLEIKPIGFDYSFLSKEDAQWIQDRTQKINSLLKRTAQNTIDIGRYITEVRASLEHGQYEQWVRTSLPIGLTSVYRYQNVYERLKDIGIEDVSAMDIAPTALYELTSAKVPNSAIIEMKELAESGEKIDIRLAKKIKKKYREVETEKSLVQKPEETGSTIDKANEAVLLPPSVRKEKQTIIEVVRRQDFWDLEQQHQIYRVEPNSDKFINALPSKISLYLGFPPDIDWTWNYKNYDSYMIFYTKYTDTDPEYTLEAVQRIIEATTNAGDAIAICYSPKPKLKILPLISFLGCKAYIAEPDYDSCLALADDFLSQ